MLLFNVASLVSVPPPVFVQFTDIVTVLNSYSVLDFLSSSGLMWLSVAVLNMSLVDRDKAFSKLFCMCGFLAVAASLFYIS
jgi:hypothetical protein